MADYTLTLNDADLAALNIGIGEIPHRLAAPLIAKINGQVREQIDGAEVEPPSDPPDPHAHMKRGADPSD